MSSKNKSQGEINFILKPIEINLLQAIQQAHNSELSNILSFIALERLAYKVTEHTQFRVEDDRLYIIERTPPEDKPEEEVAQA
jgi:hypothetical protein